MNLWGAILTVLLTLAAVLACVVIILGDHSVGVALLAFLAMSAAAFLAIWTLFRSLKGNQGADEFDEFHLRMKEIIELTPSLHPPSDNPADVQETRSEGPREP